LLTHRARRLASRADWTAGSNNAIKIPMTAIATSSSTSERPLDVRAFRDTNFTSLPRESSENGSLNTSPQIKKVRLIKQQRYVPATHQPSPGPARLSQEDEPNDQRE
jgi:hypothetical protein